LASIWAGDCVRGLHKDMTAPAQPSELVYIHWLDVSRDKESEWCLGLMMSRRVYLATWHRPDKIGAGSAASTSNPDTSIRLGAVQFEFSAVSPFDYQPRRGRYAAPYALSAGLFPRDIKWPAAPRALRWLGRSRQIAHHGETHDNS
jgi:hypothetical protein